MFDFVDFDKSGTISEAEVAQLLGILNIRNDRDSVRHPAPHAPSPLVRALSPRTLINDPLSILQVREMMAQVDRDKSGHIDFDEFIEASPPHHNCLPYTHRALTRMRTQTLTHACAPPAQMLAGGTSKRDYSQKDLTRAFRVFADRGLPPGCILAKTLEDTLLTYCADLARGGAPAARGVRACVRTCAVTGPESPLSATPDSPGPPAQTAMDEMLRLIDSMEPNAHEIINWQARGPGPLCLVAGSRRRPVAV